ncbi:MAG TPA: hypothetical protein DER33_04240 [Syntrophomonas sp.]|nr:hypothetical protein [Syntrophomonas sp.]
MTKHKALETGKQAAKDGPVAPVLTSKQNIEKTVKNEKNVDKKTNSSKQTEKTIEQRIENTINTAVGKKTNTDKKRIVKLQVLGTEKEGKKLVLAWLNADDNLSNQMIRGGILMDSAKVFQSLFELPETEEVALVWVFPLVDVYGNSADEPVLKVRLTREIADKINWDSFDHENFAEISKQYWEHTALAE